MQSADNASDARSDDASTVDRLKALNMLSESGGSGSSATSSAGFTQSPGSVLTSSIPSEMYTPVKSVESKATFTTFSYQRALLNRIHSRQLARGATLDVTKYTPTFLHDTLMLPGTLTSLLGKQGSIVDMIDRMTPAILHGFYRHVHRETHGPCLRKSNHDCDQVQGMLIFGQGRSKRDIVWEHYLPHTRRTKVHVEIEVVDWVPEELREWPLELFRRRRVVISAHAWVWSGVASPEFCLRGETPMWTLEDYIGGKLGPSVAMRVETWSERVERSHSDQGGEPDEKPAQRDI